MFGAPDSALDEAIVTMRPHCDREHVRDGCLHARERAREVHGDHAVPVVCADFEQRLERLDARAGDEDLDRSEFGAHLIERGSHRRAIGHVTLHGDRALEVRRRGLRARAVAIEQSHAVPVGRELLGDPEADTRGSTGYYCDATHQFPSTGSNSRLTLVRPRKIHVGS